MAYWLTHTFIEHADVYLDLHGGDLNEALTPFVIYAEGDRQAERFAHLFGLANVIASSSSGSSYSAGHSLGVPSVLAEAGGQGLFPETDIALPVATGQHVGFIRDFRGEVVQEAVSPAFGTVLFAVASLAINDGDPLLGIGTLRS